MKKLIAFLFIFNCTAAFSQSWRYEIDSLNNELRHAKDPVEKIPILDLLSSDYSYIGHVDSMRFASFQMLKIATEAHQDSLIALAYCGVGEYFYSTSDYRQALEFQFKSLAFAEKVRSAANIWLATKDIGVDFKELKNYPEALKYLKKCEPFLKAAAVKDITAPNRTYSHLAETFLRLGRTDSALKYIQLTNEVTLKEQDVYGFARMLYIFAGVYKAKGDADLAESYYKKCIAFSDSENMALPYITSATDYGQYLFNLKQFYLSKQYGLSALNKAKQSGNKLGVINAAILLNDAYYSLGQKDSSYYFSKLKDAYSDSVFNERQAYQIQNLSFAEQIKEKEEKAVLEEEQNQRQQNIQFALIAFGIIAFIILFLLFSRSIIANESLISFFGILGLLVVFEFINLLIHPWLASFTHDSPVLMLLALVVIASLLIPLHHRLEKWIKEKMIEKNKAIRLAAAKKTIEKLEKK